MKKFFANCFLVAALCASAYGFVIKEETSKTKDDVVIAPNDDIVIVYPNEEQQPAQEQKSDAFANAGFQPIYIEGNAEKNQFDLYTKSAKVRNCGWGGCIGQNSRPRGVMSPVTDFFKSVVSKVNNIPNWIQERFGKRRLDTRVDNAQQASTNIQVKAEAEAGGLEHNKVKNECWIPVFCGMQKKIQNWFQERTSSRKFNIEKPMKKHVPTFGKRRL